jgi:hypothetical protein
MAAITPRERIATLHNYGAMLDVMPNRVVSLEHHTGVVATVGVGMPGSISRVTALVKNANPTWLSGRPLAVDRENTPACPVRMMNDVNYLAVSEAMDGAARGASTVFGVIRGAGVGGGIVVGGRVLVGTNELSERGRVNTSGRKLAGTARRHRRDEKCPREQASWVHAGHTCPFRAPRQWRRRPWGLVLNPRRALPGERPPRWDCGDVAVTWRGASAPSDEASHPAMPALLYARCGARASIIGFRGSRVQIPPSRLSTTTRSTPRTTLPRF